MASYLNLAWSFIVFLYEDDEKQKKGSTREYGTNDSSHTGFIGLCTICNLSITLIAIALVYAIVRLYKNNTYRRYVRDFTPPTFIAYTIGRMRNRLTFR